MRASSNADLQPFFDRLAEAITAGDGRATAALWSVPALVVSQEGTRAVATKKEIEEFFGGSKDQYHAMGIVGTRAQIQSVTAVGDRIRLVHVRWPYLDQQGREVNAEASTYTLLASDDGPSIVCVMMHGVENAPRS